MQNAQMSVSGIRVANMLPGELKNWSPHQTEVCESAAIYSGMASEYMM